MRTYKVTFEDGNTITTGMNTTLPEATAYYVGQSFELDETKPAVKAVKVECEHANVDEHFGKCDDCGVEVHTCDWKTGPNGIPVLVHCADCCRCEVSL